MSNKFLILILVPLSFSAINSMHREAKYIVTSGQSLLFTAVDNQDMQMLALLLEENPTEPNKFYYCDSPRIKNTIPPFITALMRAVDLYNPEDPESKHKSLEMIQLLLQHHADPDVIDRKRECLDRFESCTPRKLAQRREYPEILALFNEVRREIVPY